MSLELALLTNRIETNHLERLKRSKSKLAEYKRFKDYLKENNISSTAILLGDDLQWAKVDSNHQILETYFEARSDKLLRDPRDLKIIENRFPYNFESNISHLLVWTKVPIESDPTSPRGDISTYTRKLINKYIWNTFVKGLGIPESNIIWFRNWHALQSIRELSHIHVLIKDLSPEQLSRIKGTPGVPLSDDDYIELAQL